MKTVFVIDDDDDVREVISFALSDEGFSVICAENGKVALDKLLALNEKDYPDLIIVDNIMPEMDGVTFIHELKEHFSDTLGKIPVALSSALGTVDPSLEKFKELKVLYKPMNLEDLLTTVKDACRN